MVRGKGSEYEREVCRELSKWWSNGERDDLLWRSAGSGAMAKIRSKSKKSTYNQYGDIHATDPIIEPFLQVFNVELKRGYNEDNFSTMIDKLDTASKKPWEKYVDQAIEDMKNAGALAWMLIWKRDRKKAIVFIPYGIAKQLKAKGASLYSIPHLRGKFKLKSGKKISIFLAEFQDFFSIVKSQHIKKVLK